MNWNTGAYSKLALRIFIVGFLVLFVSCKHSKSTMSSNSEYSKFIAAQKSQILSNNYFLKYVDEGKKDDKVILLVHGIPTSSWLYRKMIPQLVKKGYRVIVPDLLGYGQSDKPAGYDIYAPERMGSYLSELMDSLHIKSWTHVCHDGGGLWTWEMLKIDSTKVSNLVLLNTIILKEGFNPPMQMKKSFFSKMYVKTYTSNMSRKGTMKATLGNGLSNKNLCVPEMVEGYVRPTEGRVDRALYQFFSNTCVKKLPDYLPLLQSLNIPTKVIWGQKDEILVWKDQAEKVKKALNIKDKDVLILEDAKHFIQEEKAFEIVEFITN